MISLQWEFPNAFSKSTLAFVGYGVIAAQTFFHKDSLY
jgi:hypothetical protein